MSAINDKPAYLIGFLVLPKDHPSMDEYAKACHPIFIEYGAEPMVIGTASQQVEIIEGHWPSEDNKLSVVKFPSMENLKACLNSEAYLVIKPLRDEVVESFFFYCSKLIGES